MSGQEGQKNFDAGCIQTYNFRPQTRMVEGCRLTFLGLSSAQRGRCPAGAFVSGEKEGRGWKEPRISFWTLSLIGRL